MCLYHGDKLFGEIMFNRLYKIISLFILSIALFSCSTMNEIELLDLQTMSYERAVRWGEFARAKSFHKDSPLLSDFERRRLKNYRVTDYSVLNTRTPDDKNSYIIVEIKYYKNDKPVIKAISVKQHWQREEDSEVWYLSSSFPIFK